MCEKEVRDAFRVHFKWTEVEYAQICQIAAQAYREFGIPKSTFYGWKKAYEEGIKAGLARKKPMAKTHPKSLFAGCCR